MLVDGTGDGDLCAWAGAPYELGDENGIPMPCTLCTVWGDIDWSDKNFPDSEKLEQAFDDGIFTQEDRHLSGMWKTAPTLGGGNIGHTFEIDATDETSLTKAMLTGRDIIPEYEKYYRKYLGRGYKNTHVVASGSYLGLRETRRIMGDYVMTGDDFVNRARFDDEIGAFSYPVDIHIAKPNKEAYLAFNQKHTSMRYADGEVYGIPYRILLPKNLENVYVAGRCVSTDRRMQSSIRVIPSCFITGQASGVGAALAIQKGSNKTRDVAIGDLRRILRKMGAFLPD